MLWNDIKKMQGQFEFVFPSSTLVWSTPWPSQAMRRTHALTFNKWHKKKKNNKNKKVTHGAMWGCGLTSLVVCVNEKFRDIRGSNVTIRSEIWTTKIRSLGFQDIRERVTLWRLIVRSLVCNKSCHLATTHDYSSHNLKACIYWNPEHLGSVEMSSQKNTLQ